MTDQPDKPGSPGPPPDQADEAHQAAQLARIERELRAEDENPADVLAFLPDELLDAMLSGDAAFAEQARRAIAEQAQRHPELAPTWKLIQEAMDAGEPSEPVPEVTFPFFPVVAGNPRDGDPQWRPGDALTKLRKYRAWQRNQSGPAGVYLALASAAESRQDGLKMAPIWRGTWERPTDEAIEKGWFPLSATLELTRVPRGAMVLRVNVGGKQPEFNDRSRDLQNRKICLEWSTTAGASGEIEFELLLDPSLNILWRDVELIDLPSDSASFEQASFRLRLV